MLLLMVKKHDCLKHPLLFIFSLGFKYSHKKNMSFNTLRLISNLLHMYIYTPSSTCMSVNFFGFKQLTKKNQNLTWILQQCVDFGKRDLLGY